MKLLRNAAPLASLCILSATLAVTRETQSQSLPYWHEPRGNTARTGTTTQTATITDPRILWRMGRATPGINNDSLGPSIVELDLDRVGEPELVALTDRGIAAWNGDTGQRMWPTGNGEFFPMLNIVGVDDLNDDGVDDIVVMARDNTVAIYDSNGNRRWTLPPSRLTSGFQGIARIVNFSGSGAPPQLLIVRTPEGDQLKASLYTFSRAFDGQEVRVATLNSDGQISALRTAVGDFNGDGLLDLMIPRAITVSSVTNLQIAYILGNGTAPGAWTLSSSTSFAAPMGGCVPAVNQSMRTQTFPLVGGRDALAIKQSSGGNACMAVVDFDVGTNAPRLRWTQAMGGSDTSSAPFVGQLVSGGEQEIVAAFSVTTGATTVSTVRVHDALTGNVVQTFTSDTPSSTGYQYLGLARLDGDDAQTLLTTTPGGTRFLFRHDGTNFQRSAALTNTNIDRWPTLLRSTDRYGISSSGRVEPLVLRHPRGPAVLARNTSTGAARLITVVRDEPITLSPSIAGAFAAPRANGNGALLTHVTGTPANYAMRRLDASLQPAGAFVRDEQYVGAPLFLRNVPSYTSTTALRAELRGMPTPLARGSTILSPTRAGWLDVYGANPYELVPAFVTSAAGCSESIGAANATFTTSGEMIFTSNSAPITSGNRHIFDRAMGRCSLLGFDANDYFTAANVGASFVGDFLRVTTASANSYVLGFAQRDVTVGTGTMRELYGGLWSVAPQQFETVRYTPGSNITTSLPVTGALLGRAYAMVESTVGSASAPPHTLNFFLAETPLRLVSVNVPDVAAIRFAPLTPIAVDGSNGSSLIINSNPGHTSGAYVRPSIVRAEAVADMVNVTIAGWTPPDVLMDSQSGVVVKCGANYRFVFRTRVTNMASDDPRFEAWEFAPTVSAPSGPPDYTMANGMTRAWSACLDRGPGTIDCSQAAPSPNERVGRAVFTNLVAAQNGNSPVVFAANNAGQVIALENVCGTSPSVRWTFTEPRALSSLSAFDLDGDAATTELVALSSDGTYHAIGQSECTRANDPACPSDRPVCDVERRTCVECVSDQSCIDSGRGRCDLERRVCAPCAMAMNTCAVSGGTCTSATRASNALLVCACASSLDCNPGFYCRTDGDAGARGECRLGCAGAGGRCPVGQFCQLSASAPEGRCVGACSTDAECASASPSRPICGQPTDGGVRVCVECSESSQCAARSPRTPACVEQRCAECAPGNSSACAGNSSGARCLATASCGCDNDVDCNGTTCDRSAHRCVTATGDAGPSGPWVDPGGCACRVRGAPSHTGRGALSWLATLAALAVVRARAQRRKRAVLAAASMSLASASGMAQSAPAQPAVATTSAPRRAIQCGEDGSADVFAEAREQFDAGQTALLANDAAGAERALRAAIALYDSPNTHLLLGRALLAQQRMEDAYDEFELTVLLATRCSVRDATERGRARYMRSIEQGAAERAQLAPRVALLAVHFESGTPPGTSITVGARPAIAQLNDRTVAAAAGDAVSVVVTAPGYQDWRGTVTLTTGRVASIEVALQRIVEGPRVIERRVQTQLVRVTRVSPLFGVGLAVTGAGLATGAAGTVVFLLARERYMALDRACSSEACPRDPAFLSAVDRGQSMEFAGQITMYTGIGVTAAGAILTLATLPRTEWVPAPNGATVSAPRASVHVLPGLGSLSVGGAF